jgi:hypothetical protein
MCEHYESALNLPSSRRSYEKNAPGTCNSRYKSLSTALQIIQYVQCHQHSRRNYLERRQSNKKLNEVNKDKLLVNTLLGEFYCLYFHSRTKYYFIFIIG